jgi:hypothetical protein
VWQTPWKLLEDRYVLWLSIGEGILTHRCDHLDQQLSLAWLPHADVLHLPPAIGQGVVADDCFCVVRHVVMREALLLEKLRGE